jgi:hypothetical protein
MQDETHKQRQQKSHHSIKRNDFLLLGRSSIIRTVTVGSGVSPDLLTLAP